MGALAAASGISTFISLGGMESQLNDRRGHGSIVGINSSEPAGVPMFTIANTAASTIRWVIAFSTTGGRIVLGSYSPRPFDLVLK
jgi:hypothetical protein